MHSVELYVENYSFAIFFPQELICYFQLYEFRLRSICSYRNEWVTSIQVKRKEEEEEEVRTACLSVKYFEHIDR